MLESLFDEAAGLNTFNFIKRRLQHKLFPVNIAKLFRTASFIEHLLWLLYEVFRSVVAHLQNCYKTVLLTDLQTLFAYKYP